MDQSQSILAAYWPFLVAAVLIVLLPLAAFLLATSAMRGGSSWSLAKSFYRYLLIFINMLIWPILALVVSLAAFKSLNSTGSLTFLIAASAVFVGAGLYFSKRQAMGFGLVYAGLITFVLTVVLNLAALGRTAAPIVLGVALLIMFVLPIMRLKVLPIDKDIKQWGLGVAHLLIGTAFVFVLSASLFTAPSLKSTEGMPPYPSCSPGAVNPQSNQYEENKDCQDQLNKYYTDSEKIYQDRQGQAAKANAKRSAVSISAGILFIILGLVFRKRAGALNGLMAAGVIVSVYSIVSRAAISTESVRLILAILAVLVVVLITWRLPVSQE